jgi:hypothetical protein
MVHPVLSEVSHLVLRASDLISGTLIRGPSLYVPNSTAHTRPESGRLWVVCDDARAPQPPKAHQQASRATRMQCTCGCTQGMTPSASQHRTIGTAGRDRAASASIALCVRCRVWWPSTCTAKYTAIDQIVFFFSSFEETLSQFQPLDNALVPPTTSKSLHSVVSPVSMRLVFPNTQQT